MCIYCCMSSDCTCAREWCLICSKQCLLASVFLSLLDVCCAQIKEHNQKIADRSTFPPKRCARCIATSALTLVPLLLPSGTIALHAFSRNTKFPTNLNKLEANSFMHCHYCKLPCCIYSSRASLLLIIYFA